MLKSMVVMLLHLIQIPMEPPITVDPYLLDLHQTPKSNNKSKSSKLNNKWLLAKLPLYRLYNIIE
jgi:hypothetical protein